MWVLLLEKAWAKVSGSYSKTIGGYTSEGLQALTGAPTETIRHKSKQSTLSYLWNKIKTSDEANYVMCCSTYAKGSKKGIQNGHAYTLIGAYEVEGFRLVKVRNPWGNTEWTGTWSDDDKRWTDSLKKAVGFVKKEDGIFFMEI